MGGIRLSAILPLARPSLLPFKRRPLAEPCGAGSLRSPAHPCASLRILAHPCGSFRTDGIGGANSGYANGPWSISKPRGRDRKMATERARKERVEESERKDGQIRHRNLITHPGNIDPRTSGRFSQNGEKKLARRRLDV